MVAGSAVRGRLSAPLVLIGLVILNYGWTSAFGFVNDDYIWIAGVRFPEGGSWVRAAFVSPTFSPYFVRPIVALSFFANYLLGGMHAWTYHVANVSLYALNVCLVWKLATVLLESPGAGFAAALLFATHPAHPDAVTWISGRTELLATALVLTVLLLHVRGRWVLAAMTFGLALLTKESVIVVPLLAFVADRFGPRHGRGSAGIGAYLAVLAAYLWLRHASTWLFAAGVVGLSMLADGRVGAAVWTAGHQWVQLMRFLVTPLPVSGRVAAVVVVAVCGVALWVATEREWRRVWLAAWWVVVAVLPYLGFEWTQGRYVYVATIGWSFLLVALGRSLWQRLPAPAPRRALAGVAVAWIVASIAAMQWSNEQARRNGVVSQRIIDAVVEAVPQPAPQTLFVFDGLARLRMGFTPTVQTPVLMFGLPEALRLRFDEPLLDARFAEDFTPREADRTRPTVRLRWDDRTGSFTR